MSFSTILGKINELELKSQTQDIKTEKEALNEVLKEKSNDIPFVKEVIESLKLHVAQMVNKVHYLENHLKILEQTEKNSKKDTVN